jgi:hypothetical protein
MSFYIEIGTTNDNNNKVNKSVEWKSPSGGVLIDPKSTLDVIKPVFIINNNPAYLTCNYVKASFLNRQYFARITLDTGGRMIVTCSVDVLSSFDLSECELTVLRSEQEAAPTKIQDGKLPILPNEQTVQQTVSENPGLTPYGTECYIITVIGGIETNESQ